MRSRLGKHDAVAIAVAVGALRAAIGLAALTAPRTVGRILLCQDPQPGTGILVRMFGGREIALGLGVVLAAQGDAAHMRNWIQAGGMVDGADVIALAADHSRSLRPVVRWTALAGAVAATLAAAPLARAVGEP